MKINELRVGNIVNLNDDIVGGLAKVTGVFEDKIQAINSVGCNINTIHIMYVEPVFITEELLLKNGFKKDTLGYFNYKDDNDRLGVKVNDGYTFIVYARLGYYPDMVSNIDYGSNLEFPNKLSVHTLQNIWYLLTGKELSFRFS